MCRLSPNTQTHTNTRLLPLLNSRCCYNDDHYTLGRPQKGCLNLDALNPIFPSFAGDGDIMLLLHRSSALTIAITCQTHTRAHISKNYGQYDDTRETLYATAMKGKRNLKESLGESEWLDIISHPGLDLLPHTSWILGTCVCSEGKRVVGNDTHTYNTSSIITICAVRKMFCSVFHFLASVSVPSCAPSSSS